MLRYLAVFLAAYLATTLAFARQAEPGVKLGIDVLEEMNFKPLKGKRVGLLTHPAGVDNTGRSTIDILANAPELELTALYGPEHGIDGEAKAEIYVPHKTHPAWGIPVYSLYGPTRRPTAEMLSNIDVMLVDLQDVGVRSYTYVSAMRYVMEECFKAGIPVMVLDRPNPLGGLKVDGPPLEPHLMSYVGAWRVPYVHGLTIGELAVMGKRVPGVLEIPEEVRKRGQLYVIKMKGWSRDMTWPETGLRWVPTSPAIPDLSAVLGYSMTGLGAQLGGFTHGYGTPLPFRLLRYPGKSPEQLARVLNAHNIQGLRFRPVRGTGPDGATYSGVYVLLDNWETVKPTELSFHMMRLAAEWDAPMNPFTEATPAQQRLYKIHVGSEAWWTEITSRGPRARVEYFVEEWSAHAREFQKSVQPLLLYE